MGSHSQPAQPYVTPVAFLPAISLLPACAMADAAPTAPTVSAADLYAVVEQANCFTRALQSGLVTPTQVASMIEPLWQALATVATTAATTVVDAADDQLEAIPAIVAAQEFGPVMAAACAIYDDYFGVVRIDPLPLAPCVREVARTSLALFADLAVTLLDRAQLAQLSATMAQFFAVLAERTPTTNVAAAGQSDNVPARPLAPCHALPATPARYQQMWQAVDSTDRAWHEQVAFYRWKVGHHFFNWCAIFCQDALMQATTALTTGDPDAAAVHLGQAEGFLRGTTAAMWYAGDFPALLYQTIIRPSMVMPGAPAGFSGDQNADYNRMKSAKQALKSAVRTHYGAELAALPGALRQALLHFHEADIEDNEHHLIIAAQKVGADQSLAQKEWQAELPAHVHRQSDVDILRQMAEMKRREFVG